MRTSRFIGAASVAVLALPFGGALTGCMPTVRCVDWVIFDDADAMYTAATAVVVGVIGEKRGNIQLLSGPGPLHEVQVEKVVKGDFDVDNIRVAAPRDYCVENPPHPAVDPLVEGERVVLYLHPATDEVLSIDELPHPRDVENWSTLTSRQGIEPLPAGAPLPFVLSN